VGAPATTPYGGYCMYTYILPRMEYVMLNRFLKVAESAAAIVFLGEEAVKNFVQRKTLAAQAKHLAQHLDTQDPAREKREGLRTALNEALILPPEKQFSDARPITGETLTRAAASSGQPTAENVDVLLNSIKQKLPQGDNPLADYQPAYLRETRQHLAENISLILLQAANVFSVGLLEGVWTAKLRKQQAEENVRCTGEEENRILPMLQKKNER
jgi:hypothetical protein